MSFFPLQNYFAPTLVLYLVLANDSCNMFLSQYSSQASYDKATGYIKKALDAGGKLISGGLEKCELSVRQSAQSFPCLIKSKN